MQIIPDRVIFLLLVLGSQNRRSEAFQRSTAMCSSKRISCLSKSSFRFCFQAGSVTYSYGRTKHCPYGTECNEIEGKNTCVENKNRLEEAQSTTTDYTNLWVTEIGNVNGETNTPWRESTFPVWTEVSTSPTVIKQSTSNIVYKLTCGSCPMFHIGQTGRTFKKRLVEHRNCFVNGKTNSTYAAHLLAENHTFEHDFEILHVEGKGVKLNLLESLEINKGKNSQNLMNDQTELNNSPLLNLFCRNTDIFTIPIITDSGTIASTSFPWTAVATSHPFVTETHKTTFTRKMPELETTTPYYTDENTQKKASLSLTSSLTTEHFSKFNEITTRKIRRKKKPSPSKPKRRKKPTITSQPSIIKNSISTVKKKRPSTPFRKSSSSATTPYSKSKKPPKRRRKKPQKSSSTTHVPSTSTKKPPKKLKKKKKPQKTSTTSSVTQTTSTSTQYFLPATLQLDSTTTIAETSSEGTTRLSPTTEMSAALSILPTTNFFEPSPTSESTQIPSPSTTIISLSAPLPCPYYLNKLFSSSTSTTTQAAVSLTPPSSCSTTGKYPSKNCHEYFECLKVMWWYRLMIMKCKKGEGFNNTLLQCIPDDTCV